MAGPKRLRAALEKQPRGGVKPSTAAELARHLGVTPQAVAQWLAGHTTPNIQHLFRIEHLYGIKAEEWIAPS
jgi:transcriptional regulator with XRE-family HTH domain